MKENEFEFTEDMFAPDSEEPASTVQEPVFNNQVKKGQEQAQEQGCKQGVQTQPVQGQGVQMQGAPMQSQPQSVPQTKSTKRKSKESKVEVDPTEGRQKIKKQEEKRKKGNVKKYIGIFATAGIVLIAVFLCMSFFKKDKDNYFTVLDGILNNELGTFEYTFDVRTTEHTEVAQNIEVTLADLQEVEGSEAAEEGTEGDTADASAPVSSNTFVEWTNADGTKMNSWRYPKYKLTFSGICTSTDPYEADITVSLATEYHNGVLTEIIAKDGVYYLDLASLTSWLRSSSDSYLISLGEQIPDGAKYLMIPRDSFNLPSRYAEDSEVDLSKCPDLRTFIQRINFLERSITSSLKGTVNIDKCMTTSEASYGLLITGADGIKVANGVQSIVNRSGEFYKSYLSGAKGKGLYDNSQYTQALREEDNVMKALTDLMVYLNIDDLSKSNVTISGTARKYTNSKGNSTLEASLNTSFQSSEKDYNVNMTFMRSGDKGEVNAPDGSTVTKDKLPSESLVRETIWGIVDYMNPTSILLENKLELNPERIEANIKDQLIKLVNSIPEAQMYLTETTVDSYIAKYANFDDTSASKVDLVNAQIVKDFMDTVNNVTGGIYVEVEVTPEAEMPQYPEMVYEDTNIKITAKLNEETSDANLYQVDMFIINKANGSITLDLTNFSLQTLLSSVYPANNTTLLHNYDNSWDDMKSPSELVLQPSTYANISLYFVISNDTGYMDLWFGDDKLGEIVNR